QARMVQILSPPTACSSVIAAACICSPSQAIQTSAAPAKTRCRTWEKSLTRPRASAACTLPSTNGQKSRTRHGGMQIAMQSGRVRKYRSVARGNLHKGRVKKRSAHLGRERFQLTPPHVPSRSREVVPKGNIATLRVRMSRANSRCRELWKVRRTRSDSERFALGRPRMVVALLEDQLKIRGRLDSNAASAVGSGSR